MTDLEIEPLVIDNGSWKVKAGYAGDDCHRVVFSTVVGRCARPVYQISESDYKDLYVGDEAQSRRSVLNLSYPIEHGIITNWDDMETIWHHCLYDELKENPEERPIILTEPPLNPKAQKERTVQVMFEKFNALGFFLALSSKLALYAVGRGSGILIDVGDGVSHVLTIYEGHCIMPATRRLDFGGKDLTLNLQKLLHEKGYDFVNNSELEIVREMKEKLCYVAVDYEQEFGNAVDKKFELPDGNTITIGKERFMCPEALFRPIPGLESGGIGDLIRSNLEATDIDCKADLLCNTILTGGSTMFQGFPERVKKKLEAFLPRTMKIKVIAPPERKSSVWIGGSILGSLSTFQREWITKQEYEEYGPTIVHRRD